MIKLKYGKILLDVLDGYQITKSSQDVTFNDIACDFTNREIEELPEKYQEVKIIDIDNFRKRESYFFWIH